MEKLVTFRAVGRSFDEDETYEIARWFSNLLQEGWLIDGGKITVKEAKHAIEITLSISRQYAKPTEKKK